MPRWLHEVVDRSLQQRLRGLGDRGRRELAEHVSNDLWPHFVRWWEEGVPDEPPSTGRHSGRWRRSSTPAPLPPEAVSQCRFFGVTEGSVEPGIGLYQFSTAEGPAIQLHDSDCIALTYTPGPHPSLVARFLFAGQWVPAGLEARPVVALRFDEAHILNWETDADEADTYRSGRAPGGQVSNLMWDGHRLFTLDLLTVRVELTAQSVSVSTEALPSDSATHDALGASNERLARGSSGGT